MPDLSQQIEIVGRDIGKVDTQLQQVEAALAGHGEYFVSSTQAREGRAELIRRTLALAQIIPWWLFCKTYVRPYRMHLLCQTSTGRLQSSGKTSRRWTRRVLLVAAGAGFSGWTRGV